MSGFLLYLNFIDGMSRMTLRNMKKKPSVKILFFDILTPDLKQQEEFNEKIYNGGSYSEWVRKMMRLRSDEWEYCNAAQGEFPEDISKFDGVIIGGSTGDPVVGHEKPWMRKTYPFIKKIVKKKIPLLGICGGLQFTVRALGGEVVFNPKGRELGTIRVELNRDGKEDFLFKGLPKNIFVQSSHKCIAKDLLSGWQLFGSSKLCEPQAVGIGECVRLLQFHPEKSATQLKKLVRMRKEALIGEGFLKNEKAFVKFLDSIKNTEKTGKAILKNFLSYFVIPFKEHKV